MSTNVTLFSPQTVPGGQNTYVPNSQTTYDMIMGFSKNINKFAINYVSQRFPVDRTSFYYAQAQSVDEARLPNASTGVYASKFRWAYGAPPPSGIDNLMNHQFVLAETQRYVYPAILPWEGVVQGSFNVEAMHLGKLGSQLMRERSLLTWNTFANSGVTSASATSLGGGLWTSGTPTNPYIRKTLNAAAVTINQQTANVVNPSDLCVVLNPNTATQVSAAQEMTDYLKFIVGWQAYRGAPDDPNPGKGFGLDRQMFAGFEFCVDDAGYTSTIPNVTPAVMTYAVPDDYAYIISRSGGLEGIYGSVSWSTIMLFMYEDMTIENYYDAESRVMKVRAVTNWAPIISQQGALSSYIISAIYS